MTKSMWTPARRTSHSKIMGINMELVPPLLLKQPPLFWEGFPLDVAVGTCFHSAPKALVRSGTDVGRLGLARSQRSNSSRRCFMGLRSGVCAGQLSSSTRSRQTNSEWTSLCARGHCDAETGKGLPQTVATKLEAQNHLEYLYAVAFRFPFTGTKGPSPNQEKQPQTIIPPPPNFTVGTMHWGR
ncbi:hypothetical protein J4Q44_G00321660 [Coregonus suidteri]|uniref:Uncharacterized protein n=1 Tax=Coregonus suidteri TaxID=861788 RepID=A0AAN8KTN6_9TELE